MDMIEPLQSDDALLRDITSAPQSPEQCDVWWLGQSGFLLAHNGKYLLFDPYLSDSLTHKYAATDKPHERMTRLCITPEKLDFLHVVTSSHNHTDHLDAETLGPLFAANPRVCFVLPRANIGFARERLNSDGAGWVGLNGGESAEVEGFTFHGIAAAHNDLETDANGDHPYMGFVVEFGPFRLYHSGDCLLYPGLEEKLQRFGGFDLALLPINGNLPPRRVAGNFSGREAARLAKDINATTAVPCHYEMFELNTADPREFEQIDQSCRVLRCGERLTLGA
jgi:L-ascorbate metabolism protein UlaG (beta-lactamase superfamily)